MARIRDAEVLDVQEVVEAEKTTVRRVNLGRRQFVTHPAFERNYGSQPRA